MIPGMPDGTRRRPELKRGSTGGTPYRMRSRVALLACLVTGGVAHAQPGATPPTTPKPGPTPKTAPIDPYGPTAPPTPTTPAPPPVPKPPRPSEDPVLAEQVAGALVHRAQELFDARVFVDAKQLAVEALVRSPKGAAADQARFLIKAINQQLGITEDIDKPAENVDLTPITDPVKTDKIDQTPEVPARARRITASAHSAAYAGLIGATIGSFFSKDSPAGGAVPVGIGVGVAGGLYMPKLLDKLKYNEAQTRTMGSGSVWGGLIGGLFGDIGKKQGTTSREVLVGSSIGATAGAVGGAVLARDNRYTPGDIALTDTFAGIGAFGGLTIGMLMQPAESEAFSLNAALGTAGGVVAGLIAGPQTNTTPRRMLRVAGMAALGGTAPFLLYAGIHDRSKTSDERLTGALSTAGLVVGTWLGFRLTRDLDRGKDVLPGKIRPHDAPPSLLGRSSDGSWSLGALAVQPLSQKLAPQRGMALSLVGGTF